MATTKTAKTKTKTAKTTQPTWSSQVWAAVALIPHGRVCAYVDVATFLGHPLRARQVGNALGALEAVNVGDVPWQRVVNARGFLSIRGQFLGKDAQRALLLAEGVAVGSDYVVSAFPQVRWSYPLPSQ